MYFVYVMNSTNCFKFDINRHLFLFRLAPLVHTVTARCATFVLLSRRVTVLELVLLKNYEYLFNKT